MNPKFKNVTVRSSNLIVSRFDRVVEQRYQDSHLTLGHLASEMDMSQRQLQRKLRLLTGRTPSEIVRSFRLSRSLELLLSGVSVHDTATAVGFSSQAYFASCFKAEYGRTPTQYRERNITST